MNTTSDNQRYTDGLKAAIGQWGADLVGVADTAPLKELRLDPPDLLEPFKTAVSIALGLPWATFGELKGKPTPIYENIYLTANRILDDLAFRTARRLAEDGYYALPIPASQITDEKKWCGAISHKAVARMAGLGWQGKNLLLITPQYGSAVRLVTVLTDAPLAVDGPVKNRCGRCTRCQEACPADAIKGVPTENHYRDREEALHFDRCIEQLKRHSTMLEAYALKDSTKTPQPTYHQLICGLCIQACPFGGRRRHASANH